MIKRIAFVAYPTDDVTRTRGWYEDKLGLSFAGPYEEDGVERYNEAHLGDGCFTSAYESVFYPASGGSG
ncbi:MAG: VOC family protein [Vulcanimicrobiaceae bacterium]